MNTEVRTTQINLNAMKLIREHLESIQDNEIRERALDVHQACIEKFPWVKHEKVETLRQALEHGCNWTRSDQDYNFWLKIARKIHKGEPL